MLEPELICKWIGIWCFIFEFEFEQIYNVGRFMITVLRKLLVILLRNLFNETQDGNDIGSR